MGRPRRRLRLDQRHVRRGPPRGAGGGARARTTPDDRAGRRGLLRLALLRPAGTRREMSDPNLYVDFIGELSTVEPGDELTFGRQADLHVDDNRHLHRVLGRFWSRG